MATEQLESDESPPTAEIEPADAVRAVRVGQVARILARDLGVMEQQALAVAVGLADIGLLAVPAPATEKAPHCSTCICGRRAPVQGEHGQPRRASGTVTWAEHEEAYTAYAARFGTSQSAARLAERGGFGFNEMTDLLGHEPTTWAARGAR